MIHLNDIPINETPVFEELMEGQGSRTLFEDWRPASTEEFVRKYFPPFVDPADQAEIMEDEAEVHDGTFGGVLALHEVRSA
ncbi:hypothetical protein AB0F25_30305 [Streptomyces wedmorensis]|uniref:hypothetical protein n=1 Tax=Streptomyces wedmorensis TaxID=43759 RepID=UPI0034324C31